MKREEQYLDYKIVKDLIISFSLSLLISVVGYVLFSLLEYGTLDMAKKWSFVGFILVVMPFLWLAIHFLYCYLAHHRIEKWIIPLFIAIIASSISFHGTMVQWRIESESSDFTDTGILFFGEPSVSNGTYSRYVNFSIRTNSTDIEILAFDVVFKKLDNLSYSINKYYGKNVVSGCPINSSYEIYCKWQDVGKGQTAYLNLSVNWSTENEYSSYAPIDLSKTSITRGQKNLNVKYVPKP